MDDLMKQLRHGVENVVSSTQRELTDVQLKLALKELESERSAKLAALGQKVLAVRAEAGGITLEDLAAELAAVDDVDARISAKRAAHEDLRKA